MSPRERKPFFSKDRLKEFGVKGTAIVALGATGLGLAGCGPSNAGAEKSPTVATSTATPGASETPSTTTTPSATETSTSSEVDLSVLDKKTYQQVTLDMPLAEAKNLDKEIVGLVNIPSDEWNKLPKGEQAYRAGLYVEMMNAWNQKNLAIDETEGTALDKDKTYPGVTPFMTQEDFSKLGCQTSSGIAMLKKVEDMRRGWVYAVGHSSTLVAADGGKVVPQIRENLTATGLYATGEGNAEITATVFDDDTDISKADVSKLLGLEDVCGFGLNEQQFLYATSNPPVKSKYGENGIWSNAPENKPVAGISVELISTGHAGRFATVAVPHENG